MCANERQSQAEGGGESSLSILVRDGRHSRDEPSLGLRHSIDTTMMQVADASTCIMCSGAYVSLLMKRSYSGGSTRNKAA